MYYYINYTCNTRTRRFCKIVVTARPYTYCTLHRLILTCVLYKKYLYSSNRSDKQDVDGSVFVENMLDGGFVWVPFMELWGTLGLSKPEVDGFCVFS